ncbi:MAG: T9SS type A sorting domain-containing protein [Flavobacterium sp.]
MKKNYTFTLFCFCILFSISCFATNPTASDANCTIPNPININTCSTPLGSVVLGGLPSGNWTLYRVISSGPAVSFTGSGTTYTDTGLASDCYQYTVADSNGCFSSGTYICVGYLDGLSGTMTATYVDYNADGVTNVGDVVRYNLSITNNTICPVDVAYDLGGMGSPSGMTPTIAVGGTYSLGFLDYVLTQADINSGSVFNWVALRGTSPNGASSYSKVFMNDAFTLPINDGIKLNAFFDNNNNGIQDSGEPNITTGFFNYVMNNDGVTHTLYSQTGISTVYETNPANSYNLSFGSHNYCDGQNFSSSASYTNVHVTAGYGITTYNFPVSVVACQDLQVFLYGMFPRPGTDFTNYISYINYGNQTLASGTITFTKDNALTISSISEPTAVITPTGFTYSFTNLAPNQYKVIAINMAVPPMPAVNIGDQINNSVTSTIPPADINPTNNSDAITCTIVNSYDPNNKLENHGGKILHSAFTSNDYLTYTINFENTGNANAINIRVNDILDSKLDETSIRMINASHPYTLERINNNLNWKFDGINLPPSSGSATVGHGRIVFKIKPKPGFAVGDIIPNAANIYFDSNPAIVTNTFNTEFVQTLGTASFAFDKLEYYPNPVKNNLILSNAFPIERIEIVSVLGQKVKSVKIDGVQAQIDLSGLTKGVYFVKVTSENQEKMVKIIKE